MYRVVEYQDEFRDRLIPEIQRSRTVFGRGPENAAVFLQYASQPPGRLQLLVDDRSGDVLAFIYVEELETGVFQILLFNYKELAYLERLIDAFLERKTSSVRLSFKATERLDFKSSKIKSGVNFCRGELEL